MTNETLKNSTFKNKLFLIPSPISDEVVTSETFSEPLGSLNWFIVENIKTARRVLRKYGFKKDFDSQVYFFEIDKHNPNQSTHEVETWMKNGYPIGLMSEAGMPCIADPGSQFVFLAHQNNYEVIPWVGPSSLFLSLAGSGLNGQQFCFHGYLPIDKIDRNQKLQELSSQVKKTGATQIFIEAPYRNQTLFEAILSQVEPQILLCIAANLTGENQILKTMSIAQWKKNPLPDIHKIPTIFLLGRVN